MGRRTTEQGNPVSIRLKKSLLDDLAHAAEQLDLSLHDTMRKCLKIGLAELERINFDEIKLIIESKLPTSREDPGRDIALLAEKPVNYRTRSKSHQAG